MGRSKPSLVVLAVCAGAALAAQPTTPTSSLPRLVIAAGETSRTNALVEVQLPPTVRGADLQLRHETTGAVVPLQIGPDREAWALVPSIPAERAQRYRIEPAVMGELADRAVAVRQDTHVRVEIDGGRAFSYVGEPGALPAGVEEVYRRGGYIHPVVTPGGRRVTGDYPRGHKHHHGIWAAWASARVDGRAPDFWNMADRTGRVEFERLARTWSGPLAAGFLARHRYVDLTAATPTTVLLEDWRVVAYAWPAAPRPAHVFDITITQERVGATPIDLQTYRYGGIGLRGRDDWGGPDRTTFLTSTGRTRLSGHGTRVTWVHMGGLVDGARAGLAVLSHPDNTRSPQPVRIHPAEPFLAFAPLQAGPLQMRPRDPFVMRYRIVATDGPPDAALLDAIWQAYALPGVVRIE